jgi:hypothetical protein
VRERVQRLSAKFPTRRNREFFEENTESWGGEQRSSTAERTHEEKTNAQDLAVSDSGASASSDIIYPFFQWEQRAKIVVIH